MALPVTGTVIANWSDWRGRSGVEPIKLTPTAQLAYHNPTDRAYVSTAIMLYPNADGEASAVVLATDSADVAPAGWGYEVTFPRSWGVPPKVILVPTGTTVDLFAAAGVVPETDIQTQVVLSVNGIEPDETGDVTIEIAGGEHTHPQSDIVGLTAALAALSGSVATAQDTADVAGATAEDAQSAAVSAAAAVVELTESLADTDGALQALDVEVGGIQTALGLQDDRISELEEAPGPARLKVRQAYITSGSSTPNTSGVWQAFSGFSLSIPAVVGDYVKLNLRALRTNTPTTLLDVAVSVGGGLVRYLATGGPTPATEGDPGWYFASSFTGSGGSRGFTVTADDLDGGNVVFVVAVKSDGGGTLYATADYPFYWQAENFGPVD